MRSAFTINDLPECLGLLGHEVKEQGPERTHQNASLKVTLRIWTYRKWVRRYLRLLRSTAMQREILAKGYLQSGGGCLGTRKRGG